MTVHPPDRVSKVDPLSSDKSNLLTPPFSSHKSKYQNNCPTYQRNYSQALIPNPSGCFLSPPPFLFMTSTWLSRSLRIRLMLTCHRSLLCTFHELKFTLNSNSILALHMWLYKTKLSIHNSLTKYCFSPFGSPAKTGTTGVS